MMPKNVFFFLLCCSFSLAARDNLRLPDVRSMALGGNGVTQSELYNPSLAAWAKRRSVQLNYFNRYGMKELGTVGGSLSLPNRLLPVAFNVCSFGYDAYRESMFRASVGKALNRCWAVGVAFHWSMLETELYDEPKGRVSTDVGIICRPFDNLSTGLLIMNAVSVHTGDQTTRHKGFVGRMIQLGMEWNVIDNLLITACAGSGEERAWNGSAGLEYEAFHSFYVRSGVEINPLMPCFGAGYELFPFAMDVAAVYHPVLGVNTGIGITFSF
ncbi:MAG: hypothetical protein LBV32_02645 [Tannerellaceae bacterium]|jgi:hypothetical protein|nr:hypothetical protein [Tannerellaceae bacterium]